MNKKTSSALQLAVLSSFLLSGRFSSAQTPLPAPATISKSTLLQFDFETATWPGNSAAAVGTIDVADSLAPSRGLRSEKMLRSGPLAIQNRETDLAKLTLAFNLSASAAQPVKVRVESFDKRRNRTGGLETTIRLAAPDFYQRFALELSNLKAFGSGKFQPDAPFVAFSLETDAAAWKGISKPEIRLDNLNYASPAYYVSPNGSDQNDGRTEKTAFATPQHAVKIAGPGDIILLMNGTYQPLESTDRYKSNVKFERGGVPAAWVTLKNYPGHQPILLAESSQALRIERLSGESLAYIEVRGLHIRGNGDGILEQYASEIGKPRPKTAPTEEPAGIHVFGRGSNRVHHIRIADNLIEFAGSNGIYIDCVDYFAIENNEVRNNCWPSLAYAPAGITVMKYADFDRADNVTKSIVTGNRVSGNRRYFVGWDGQNPMFNGNGILIDANAENPPAAYLGRTLVSQNLVFGNGGGGVQLWGNRRIDVMHNTLYFNGASPLLKWGQMTVERCRDVRIVNNIIVAQPDRPLNRWFKSRPDANAFEIVRRGNVYFGGIEPPVPGEADLIADPLFVAPSIDEKVADFRLQPGSPALGKGALTPAGPQP